MQRRTKMVIEALIGIAAAVGLAVSSFSTVDILAWSLGGAAAVVGIEVVDALIQRPRR